MKKLMDLESWNHERTKFFNGDYVHFTGIACPECGSELIDSNPHSILVSWPPKKTVHCSKCGYKGDRIA